MAGTNKTRTTPFRILAYLLYGKFDWIEIISPGRVRIKTGPASRHLRLRNVKLWECLYWLEQSKLICKVEKHTSKGTVTIHLLPSEVFNDQA